MDDRVFIKNPNMKSTSLQYDGTIYTVVDIFLNTMRYNLSVNQGSNKLLNLKFKSGHALKDVSRGTISLNRMQKAAHWLLVIGGLNWLLVGLLSWDIGDVFGGQDAMISRVIYILVGLAALVSLKPKSSSSMPQM
jgi:uncharacterized membrane protein YuzA (DUF378 family)